MKKQAVKIPGDYYFDRSILPLALKKVQGNTVTHPHDYTAIPHWHNFSELVIITGGHGIQNINGTSYPVSAGDVFVIMGRTTHFFEDHTHLDIINIMFDDRLFYHMHDYLNRIPGYHVIFRFEPELRSSRTFRNTLHLAVPELLHVHRLTSLLHRELTGRSSGYEASAIAALLELSIFLARTLDNCRKPAPITRLAALFTALESSYQEDWPLSRMAKFCGMSVNTLLRTFQAVVHQTPLQYLLKLRMNAARLLISEGNMSVAQTAFACGFHDSNYFTKCFKKYFHSPPLTFLFTKKEK
ncbi:MAG: helix-turn-helix domain-containing protein [Lentisphaeria bacterium]|nr:helix-turn-helix domain-containing protein [Lentisphaeria bacterium]